MSSPKGTPQPSSPRPKTHPHLPLTVGVFPGLSGGPGGGGAQCSGRAVIDAAVGRLGRYPDQPIPELTEAGGRVAAPKYHLITTPSTLPQDSQFQTRRSSYLHFRPTLHRNNRSRNEHTRSSIPTERREPTRAAAVQYNSGKRIVGPAGHHDSDSHSPDSYSPDSDHTRLARRRPAYENSALGAGQ